MKEGSILRRQIFLCSMFLAFIAVVRISPPAMAAFPPWTAVDCVGSHYASTLTNPVTIDGIISEAEWGDAAPGCNIRLYNVLSPGAFRSGQLLIKQDGTDLYILLLVDTTGTSGTIIQFDGDGVLPFLAGDDGLIWGPPSEYPLARDLYSGGDSAPAALFDVDHYGSEDGAGAGAVATGSGENYTVFELRKELDSPDDLHDFSLAVGDSIGFRIVVGIQGPDIDWINYGYPDQSAGLALQQLVIPAPAAIDCAYIYRTDTTSAAAFESFLETNTVCNTTLYDVDTFTPTPDLTSYEVIIIGSDTGGLDWGGPVGSAAAINAFGKPILGLGEGGYAFFGSGDGLSLEIGCPNGAHWISGFRGITLVDPTHTIFTSPHLISSPATLYTDSGGVGIYVEATPPLGVTLLGSLIGDPQYYPLIQEVGSPYLLWGFQGNTSVMTSVGQDLFENVVLYLAGAPTTDPCYGQGGDVDNDNVCGDIDNCPTIANTDQADTDFCPDTGLPDRVGDACDKCPLDCDPLQEDNDVGGDPQVPKPDGVGEPCDNCPAVWNPGQEDIDEDEVGDACDECANDPTNECEIIASGEVRGSGLSMPGEDPWVQCSFEIKSPAPDATTPLYIFPPDDCNTMLILTPSYPPGPPVAAYDCIRGYAYGVPPALGGTNPEGDQIKLTPQPDPVNLGKYRYHFEKTVPILLYKKFDDPELYERISGSIKKFTVQCRYEWFQQDPDIQSPCPEGKTCYQTAIGSFTGDAGTLSFLNAIRVEIDMPDSINLGSQGKTPVIIYGIESIPGDQIDPDSVEVGGTGIAVKGKGTRYMMTIKDFNGDGILDLKLHVETQAMELTEGEEYVLLTGQTYGGTHFGGEDTIRVVPPQ